MAVSEASCTIRMLNVALNEGSSKLMNALRASIASSCDMINHLKILDILMIIYDIIKVVILLVLLVIVFFGVKSQIMAFQYHYICIFVGL